MQKLLLKKISARLVLVTIISILIFSLILFQELKYENISKCEDLLNEILIKYEDVQKNLYEKLELYKEDYLNRTYSIEFILKNNIDMRSNEGLEKINSLMQVDSIYIVNKTGEVVLSTEKNIIGVNLLDYEECKNIWPLINDTSVNDSVIDLESDTIIDKTPKDFFAIKSSIEDYSIIQIGINRNNGSELLKQTSIAQILKGIPTLYTTTAFAIDKTTGEKLGITTNNEQTLDFSLDDKEYIIDMLINSNKSNTVKLNDKYVILKAKVVDDIILGVSIDISSIFHQIISQVFIITAIIIIILILLYFTIKGYFEKYVINDFNNINENIKKIVSGNLNVTFKASNKENKYLMDSLNNWKNSYKNKNFRMSKLITGINDNVAIFECLYSVNTSFFSENLKPLLDIDDNTWNEIQENPCILEEYIENLKKDADINGIIYFNNKYIVVKSYSMENTFFGTILDKTDEIIRNKTLLNKLEEAKINADKDYLTELLNRNAFEREVKSSLEKNNTNGIMLLFDLDNFKKINDTLGHPEGDLVLKLIANTLKNEFRKDDIIARLGGDEFTVFINQNIPLNILENKLNNLLANSRKNLHVYYSEYNASMSIGVSYIDDTINTYEDLYKCADTALYIAKNLGKNRYYINLDNISCIHNKCINCTGNCKKKKVLGL